MEDLYADIDDAQARLPSTTGLMTELAAVRAEREALEARLTALRAENATGRAAIQDLTRRACVILATARRELQRKDEQHEECRRELRRAVSRASKNTSPVAPSPQPSGAHRSPSSAQSQRQPPRQPPRRPERLPEAQQQRRQPREHSAADAGEPLVALSSDEGEDILASLETASGAHATPKRARR